MSITQSFEEPSLMNSNQPITWSLTDVTDWLSNIVQLPEYQSTFSSNDISGRELLQLTNDDLKDMSVDKVGHRKKILLEIQSLIRRQNAHFMRNHSQQSQLSQSTPTTTNTQTKRKLEQETATTSEEPKRPRFEESAEPKGDAEEQKESSEASASLKNKNKQKEKIVMVTCMICFEEKDKDETFKPINCQANEACENVHVCTECLREYVMEKIKSRSFPIVCPNTKCAKEIMADDLQHLLSMPQMALFYRNSFEYAVSGQTANQKVKFLQCPTPDCKYIVSYDDLNEDNCHFRCELCREHYCLSCRVPYHYGKTCVGYQKWKKLEGGGMDPNDALFFQYVDSKHIQRCPSCARFVERSAGCSSMSCLCGAHFCYGCGKESEKCICHLIPPRAVDYDDGDEDEE